MAQGFNQLLDELARKEAQEKRLLSDIAHDLRTPLTVLQADLEALEDGLLPCTPEHLKRLQGEVGLLARLVEDLHLLSTADTGGLHLSLEPLDPQVLAEAALEAQASRAASKGVTLNLRGRATLCYADHQATRRYSTTSWTTPSAIPPKGAPSPWSWLMRAPGYACWSGTRGQASDRGRRRRCSFAFTAATPPAPEGEAGLAWPSPKPWWRPWADVSRRETIQRVGLSSPSGSPGPKPFTGRG